MSFKRIKKTKSDIEISGLIDLVFILLIFFFFIVSGSGGKKSEEGEEVPDLPILKSDVQVNQSEPLKTLVFRIGNPSRRGGFEGPDTLYVLLPFRVFNDGEWNLDIKLNYERALNQAVRNKSMKLAMRDRDSIRRFVNRWINGYCTRILTGEGNYIEISAVGDTPFWLIKEIMDTCIGTDDKITNIYFRTSSY